MKLLEQPKIECEFNKTRLIITLPTIENHRLQRLLDEIGTINQDDEYEIKIAKKRRRRSLDANAYMWVLCSEIAKKINATAEEVYKEQVKHYGVSDIMIVKEQAFEK